MTLLLAANMDGIEKLEPFVIGKSQKPRCFKNVKKLTVIFKANKNAWMTSILWNIWLQSIDNVMRLQDRHILMSCDHVQLM